MALLILLLSFSPDVQAAKPTDPEADTHQLVNYVLATETSELKAELIPPFFEVDLKSLPKKMRPQVRAKRAELSALKKIADGKKKPPLRRVGKDPNDDCLPEEATPRMLSYIKRMGFQPIYEDEERYLEGKTNCSMCELTQEFSLTLYQQQLKKGRTKLFMFLHAKDPLMALVGQYREGNNAESTNFFAVGFFGACR
jgi:hypothetical protein